MAKNALIILVVLFLLLSLPVYAGCGDGDSDGPHEPWVGSLNITESDDLGVCNFDFEYCDVPSTQVDRIFVTLSNTDIDCAHSATVLVTVSTDGTVVATDDSEVVAVPSGEEVETTVMLRTSVAEADFDLIDITVRQTS